MRVVQINVTVNTGSTGRIAEDVGQVLLDNGHESYIAYGRGDRPSKSQKIKIGSSASVYLHGVKSLLLDRHGFGSAQATRELIERLKIIRPDVIALHNLHGYYLHIGELFRYLRSSDVPVLWTLFDCWAFTGHCSYYDDLACTKWQDHCKLCPKTGNYPKSLFVDNSYRNFDDKRDLFTSLNRMELLVHSNWLAGELRNSYLSGYQVHVTPSAVDTDVFRPMKSDLQQRCGLEGKRIILGCANIWSSRKGLNDFIRLRTKLSDEYAIVLIGVNKKQQENLSGGILGIGRTESVEELAAWYSLADVFVNPTWQDNFPTTNIEALACGTPVITYQTGGSPEAVDEYTGRSVERGDLTSLVKAIKELGSIDREKLRSQCRNRALRRYNKRTRYLDYLEIFENLLKKA